MPKRKKLTPDQIKKFNLLKMFLTTKQYGKVSDQYIILDSDSIDAFTSIYQLDNVSMRGENSVILTGRSLNNWDRKTKRELISGGELSKVYTQALKDESFKYHVDELAKGKGLFSGKDPAWGGMRKNPSSKSSYSSGLWYVTFQTKGGTMYLFERYNKNTGEFFWGKNFYKAKAYKTGLGAKKAFNSIWKRLSIKVGDQLGYAVEKELKGYFYDSSL